MRRESIDLDGAHALAREADEGESGHNRVWFVCGILVALSACSPTISPPMAIYGTEGSGARVELGKGAAINGPLTIRNDNGAIVDQMALGAGFSIDR
jgi:hypothetical protein